MKQGLKERIANARTSKEVDGFLKEGEGFKEASDSTRRRWQRAAKAALKGMGENPPSKTQKKKKNRKIDKK
tara:strand:- start:562 stop:774 length:213 start_codon:yes stop_codon:yes gene_type:complete